MSRETDQAFIELMQKRREIDKEFTELMRREDAALDKEIAELEKVAASPTEAPVDRKCKHQFDHNMVFVESELGGSTPDAKIICLTMKCRLCGATGEAAIEVPYNTIEWEEQH